MLCFSCSIAELVFEVLKSVLCWTGLVDRLFDMMFEVLEPVLLKAGIDSLFAGLLCVLAVCVSSPVMGGLFPWKHSFV